MKIAGPAYSLPVSQEEINVAKAIRKSFQEVLKQQERLLKYMSIFFDHLDALENKTGLAYISPLIKQYEHKMRKKFNNYINAFSEAISTYQKGGLSDGKMDDIRDLLVENIRKIREYFIELLIQMKKVSSEEFAEKALEKYNAVKTSSEQIESIIRDEWFGHIDYNILGLIRLGESIVPLSIIKWGFMAFKKYSTAELNVVEDKLPDWVEKSNNEKEVSASNKDNLNSEEDTEKKD